MSKTCLLLFELMLSMPAIEHNLKHIKQAISDSCKRSGRPVATLLAVSKKHPAEAVLAAYHAGQCEFGENYADEAVSKMAQLPKEIVWHFIGPIQSNKTRMISENFQWVHSVDRLKIIKRLNEQRLESAPALQCLIQVNISNEPQKAGASIGQIGELAAAIHQAPKLEFRGLMAIPKAQQSEQQLAENFRSMAVLLQKLKQHYPQCDTLSMGMSKDYQLAIEHGANVVRIGTDIFGQRD